MASRSQTLCIGVTGNFLRRVFQHKWREHDGFTQRCDCDRLVWVEPRSDVSQAIAREKELKGLWRDEGETGIPGIALPRFMRKWQRLWKSCQASPVLTKVTIADTKPLPRQNSSQNLAVNPSELGILNL
jgi:predicted GIY-YIG superfamily endonuclease